MKAKRLLVSAFLLLIILMVNSYNYEFFLYFLKRKRGLK